MLSYCKTSYWRLRCSPLLSILSHNPKPLTTSSKRVKSDNITPIHRAKKSPAPLTPYFEFENKVRPMLKEQYPAKKYNELKRMVAAMWTIVPETTKHKMLIKYSRKFEKYVEKMTNCSKMCDPMTNLDTPMMKGTESQEEVTPLGTGEFASSFDASQFGIENRVLVDLVRKKKRSLEEMLGLPSKPVKPLEPFQKYQRDVFPMLMRQNPKSTAVELTKFASTMYSKLSEVEKLRRTEEYSTKLVSYVKEMQDYWKKRTQEELDVIEQEKVKLFSLKQIRKQKKLSPDVVVIPSRPKFPGSAYNLFFKSRRKEATARVTKEEFSTIVSEWNSMPEEERATYRHEAAVLNEKYKQDKIKWTSQIITSGLADNVGLSVRQVKSYEKRMKLQRQSCNTSVA